jgi:tRNA (guanine-N7-)-methyltransferase
VLKPEGIVHLKTDDDHLYQYTLEVIASDPRCELIYHDDDIYSHELPFSELDLKTFYETQHLAKGKTIKYIRFRVRRA